MDQSVSNRLRRWLAAAFGALLAATIFPADAWAQTTRTVIERGDGVGAIWVFANISFAAMRAQNHPSTFWRIVSFLFGFPGTLLSLIVVVKGGGSMYGIRLPTVDGGDRS